MSIWYTPDNRVSTFIELYESSASPIVTEPGTRYHTKRDYAGMEVAWMHHIQEHFNGELIPFEWVPQYVNASRGAVHKRMKKGQLSILAFMVIPASSDPKTEKKKIYEYRYVPRTECNLWKMSELAIPEKGDIAYLRSPHIPGWWNDIE